MVSTASPAAGSWTERARTPPEAAAGRQAPGRPRSAASGPLPQCGALPAALRLWQGGVLGLVPGEQAQLKLRVGSIASACATRSRASFAFPSKIFDAISISAPGQRAARSAAGPRREEEEEEGGGP